MPRTQINCPQCRQPIVADIIQLFDVGETPQAKQIFLSGAFNIAQCPNCGFQGMLSTPLVYHDPEKELLLTFFPSEMMKTREEQERMLGPMITRVVNSLPQEKRKGYLLNPRTMFTIQTMLETVLEADGITKEMIQAQENRMKLIQRLMAASEESRVEIIQQEDAMIDGDFFAILSRLMESAIMSRDENAATQLNNLQSLLLEHASTGKELQKEAKEVQAAVQSLQELKDGLTREKLLELIIEAPTDTRLRALVRMARPGMDYAFFQLLSQQIETARDQDRARLIDTREKLLKYTQEIDQELEARHQVARQNLDSILKLKTEQIEVAIQQNIQAIDEFFVEAANQALEAARKKGDLERSAKIQKVLATIEEAQKLPPEFDLIDELLEIADDESALKQTLEAHADEITPDLIQMLTGLVNQTQGTLEQVEGADEDEQKEVLRRLQTVHGAVLRFSMRRSLKGS